MDKRPPIGATVMETYIQAKTGKQADCEDRIHVSDYFIAVIDGATSKTNDRWDGKTGGRKAAEIIDATFHQMPHDCTAKQAADLMTANIREFYPYNVTCVKWIQLRYHKGSFTYQNRRKMKKK